MPEDFADDMLMVPEAEVEEPSIPPEQFVAWATSGQNLVVDMSDEERNRIAQQVITDYQMDKDSMSEWLDKMRKGIDLAKLAKEKKNYPFENAANVKYPLVTSAALQFNARAYPAIVPSDRVVKAKVWGQDAQGLKAARAERVSEFMSWQLAAQITEWEKETDKLLVMLPIVGECVRKWWADPVDGRARCRLIEPGKFIVNDQVKCLDDAPRLTEEIPLYPSEIETRLRSGQFAAFDWVKDPTDKQGPQDFIEQHTRIDLDEDGYDEPYIAMVHCDTQTLVRLVADFAPEDVRYDREMQTVEVMAEAIDPMTGMLAMVAVPTQQEVVTGIIRIHRGTYFVDFSFMPSIDGGFHGTGLGLLLGDMSEAINSIINLMLDAGQYAALGGGFIGAEFRLKGGAQRMRPGEWRLAQNTGAEIAQSIVPLRYPGPDATLFQMLGLLIEGGREISATKDIMTGDAPANQPATTTLALIEQGMTVFTAAYKRIFASLKQEYKLLAKINQSLVSPEEYNAFMDGGQAYDPQQDFGAADMDVEPVADPRSVTKMQEAAKAQLVMQMAESGMVDKGEALKRVTQAADIPDVEQLAPKPDPMAQMMQKAQVSGAMISLMKARVDVEDVLADIESKKAKAMKDMADADATAKGTRLDGLRMMLEEERARLDQLLGSLGGMAGAPGNGGAPSGNPAVAGPPQRGAGAGIPVGQAGPRGGPQGPAHGGGAVAGLL